MVAVDDILPTNLRAHKSLFDGPLQGILAQTNNGIQFPGHPEAGRAMITSFDHFIVIAYRQNRRQP